MAEGGWTVMMMCSGPLELTIPTHPNLLLSQPLLRTRVELVFANSKTSICQYIGWLALAPRRSHCCSMFQFLFTVTVQIQQSHLTMYSVYSFMPLFVYSSTHPPVSVPGLQIHIIYYILYISVSKAEQAPPPKRKLGALVKTSKGQNMQNVCQKTIASATAWSRNPWKVNYWWASPLY